MHLPSKPKASTIKHVKEHRAASTKTRESNVVQFQEELIPKTDEATVVINRVEVKSDVSDA